MKFIMTIYDKWYWKRVIKLYTMNMTNQYDIISEFGQIEYIQASPNLGGNETMTN